MFKSIEGLPADVLAIEATGQITHQDYRDTLIPMAEGLMAKGPIFHGEVRLFPLAQLPAAKHWITAPPVTA